MDPFFYLNPLNPIWRTIDSSWVLTHSFHEYLKLAKMVIVHVLGNVEDERCFSFLTFLKSKL
jgi:hypothetical protein